MTQPVTVQAGCPGGAVCVQVDATSVTGPATLRADGLVAGPDSTDQTRTTLISALRPRWWRLGAGPSLGYGQYDAAAAFHPLSITEVLSGNWFQKTFSPTRGCGGNPVCYAEPQLFPSAGGAQPPWSNWAQYQSFIGGEVAAIGRSGRRVDYWDIQNEPPGTAGTGYFDQADTTSITLADEEEQIGVAYRAIKAVDPAAKVVCPSLVAFASYPGEYQPRDQLLDFTTLLDFLEKTHITCDALSWHENLGGPVPTDFNNQPDAVVAHVSLLRALLAQHPGVGHPLLFANEYGSPYTFSAPGWTAGHIAGLEAADVDQANRSCWSADGCDAGLDGLLVPGTTTPVSSDRRSVAPSASYWVQSFYAQMNGDVVPVSSSAEQVSSFATRDDATRILKVLLGRHESTGASMGQSGGAPPPRPNSVLLTIRIPWRTGLVRVGIQTIPNQSGPVDSPPVATALVAANNGSVQITLPVFSDGEARALTLQPA